MADTVNLSEAAALLGVSLPTARRRVARGYRGDDKIKGARRIGRDWSVPISEIDRLVGLRKTRMMDTFGSIEPAEIATVAWLSLAGEALRRLDEAARQYATEHARPGTDASLADLGEKTRELTDAVEAHQRLSVMVKLIEEIRRLSG